MPGSDSLAPRVRSLPPAWRGSTPDACPAESGHRLTFPSANRYNNRVAHLPNRLFLYAKMWQLTLSRSHKILTILTVIFEVAE